MENKVTIYNNKAVLEYNGKTYTFKDFTIEEDDYWGTTGHDCEIIKVIDKTKRKKRKNKDWKVFSKERKEGIQMYIAYIFLSFMDSREANALAEKILNAVIKDIKETADWSEYDDDEYNNNEIEMAVGRVLMKKFRVEA